MTVKLVPRLDSVGLRRRVSNCATITGSARDSQSDKEVSPRKQPAEPGAGSFLCHNAVPHCDFPSGLELPAPAFPSGVRGVAIIGMIPAKRVA